MAMMACTQPEDLLGGCYSRLVPCRPPVAALRFQQRHALASDAALHWAKCLHVALTFANARILRPVLLRRVALEALRRSAAAHACSLRCKNLVHRTACLSALRLRSGNGTGRCIAGIVHSGARGPRARGHCLDADAVSYRCHDLFVI
jgi:hypothetical protein